MKADLTTPASYLQSMALKNSKSKTGKELISPALPLAHDKKTPDYKLDLNKNISLPSLDTPLPVPSIPKPQKLTPPPELENEIKSQAQKKAQEISTRAPEKLNQRPAIFFIQGLELFSSPSKSEGGYAGMGKMCESIEGSRLYSWDQKDEIIEQIQKTDQKYPVVLVGHSLGGDTAIEIANSLDSLEQKFRPIDLLITVDSIGFSHDIIPQNVKKHLNIFGENSLLKDGPHVARREEMTDVRNILSPLDHTDIDDDREVQFEIISLIQNTLGKGP